jgi:hypothetical protein
LAKPEWPYSGMRILLRIRPIVTLMPQALVRMPELCQSFLWPTFNLIRRVPTCVSLLTLTAETDFARTERILP